MKTAPQLFTNDRDAIFSKQLFSDINLDRLLNEDTLAILQKPCDAEEIVLRQEIFSLLENGAAREKLEVCLKTLNRQRDDMFLWKNAETTVESYYLNHRALRSYIDAEKALCGLSDCGKYFGKVSAYFSSDERKMKLSALEDDMDNVGTLLQQIGKVTIFLSDQSMADLTDETSEEFGAIAEYAKDLGFSVPKKKELRERLPASLSKAITTLCPDNIVEIENIFGKYSDIEFSEHWIYISEIKFFLDIFTFISKAKEIGVPTCFAEIADKPEYTATEAFDISLLAKNCKRIVPNDIEFTQKEPFFLLIGANGGGKTTYLRAVAINLIFFLSGCPVFAKEAKIYPFEFIASHFPKDERFDDSGRLDEERKRVNEMISDAENKSSFLFFNETFSGTDEKRGMELLEKTVKKIEEYGFFGLYVTHFHEAVGLSVPVLSAKVDTENGNERTFRIIKSKGSPSSYAADILKKYGLDKNSLIARREKDAESTI